MLVPSAIHAKYRFPRNAESPRNPRFSRILNSKITHPIPRRPHVFLKQEGFRVNHKRLFRLYREERLMVRRRGGRKRALGNSRADEHPTTPE
jgi:hypothetical protein